MDKKLDEQTGEAEEKDDPFKISDLGTIILSVADSGWWRFFVYFIILLYSRSKICRKYAAM